MVRSEAQAPVEDVTRRVLFRPQAEAEALDARDWYEARRAGLGREFARDLTWFAASNSAIVRSDRFDRMFRVLALVLIAELLWLSWLKADTPAGKPSVLMPHDEAESLRRSEAEPRAMLDRLRALEPPKEDQPTEGLGGEDPAIERLPAEPWAPEESDEILTMVGDSAAAPQDPAEEERRLHPPPPCEIEVVDAEGQPRVECAVVALGADDHAIALTWTNSAGIARLPSKNMNVDLVIDAGSRLHREPNVLLSSFRHRVEILGGVEISGRAMLDDRPASPGDGLEIVLSRTEELPEPFKTARADDGRVVAAEGSGHGAHR